jgi:hypothetical protein
MGWKLSQQLAFRKPSKQNVNNYISRAEFLKPTANVSSSKPSIICHVMSLFIWRLSDDTGRNYGTD